MKAGDEVILMYAVIPKEKWGKVNLPAGSFAKAFTTGKIEQFIEVKECKGWGAFMAASINRLARKLCPEIAESPIIQIGGKEPHL